MADLSHADKLILLGADYEAEARQTRLDSGVTDERQAKEEAAVKLEGLASGGVYFALVGALILLSNYFAISGPYNGTLTLIAAAMLVGGAALTAWARTRRARVLGQR